MSMPAFLYAVFLATSLDSLFTASCLLNLNILRRFNVLSLLSTLTSFTILRLRAALQIFASSSSFATNCLSTFALAAALLATWAICKILSSSDSSLCIALYVFTRDNRCVNRAGGGWQVTGRGNWKILVEALLMVDTVEVRVGGDDDASRWLSPCGVGEA